MATKKEHKSKDNNKKTRTIKLYEAIFFSVIAIILVFVFMKIILNF